MNWISSLKLTYARTSLGIYMVIFFFFLFFLKLTLSLIIMACYNLKAKFARPFDNGNLEKLWLNKFSFYYFHDTDHFVMFIVNLKKKHWFCWKLVSSTYIVTTAIIVVHVVELKHMQLISHGDAFRLALCSLFLTWAIAYYSLAFPIVQILAWVIFYYRFFTYYKPGPNCINVICHSLLMEIYFSHLCSRH